tara:strand:- start:575 stop:853 length:279 start_codon:yes stop_codon:yes gene_type:complete
MVITAEGVLISWLISTAKSSDPWFYSYDLERQVPIYGELAHHKFHTASTYARVFRKIRNSNVLAMKGYQLTEIENRKEKVKGWKVSKMKNDI